jgi:aminocarboxymuconate-semialdehyde decarboxylase
VLLGRFWIDALVHDPAMLQFRQRALGPQARSPGHGYPFPLGELEPGSLIRSMPWEDDKKEMC